MPTGMHWEWRGFGATSNEFRSNFASYKPLYPDNPVDKTEDAYLWVPGCPINVKLRRGGAQQGLKLKRFIQADGDVELWFEDPRELYPFDKMDFQILDSLAMTLGIRMSMPSGALTLDAVQSAVRNATPPCSIVTIIKSRETRIFSPTVQMEFAQIERVLFDDVSVATSARISVAVENNNDVKDRPQEEVRQAKREVEAAIKALGLRNEKLIAMNYLTAIAKWHTAMTSS